jgi:hypothetical protein
MHGCVAHCYYYYYYYYYYYQQSMVAFGCIEQGIVVLNRIDTLLPQTHSSSSSSATIAPTSLDSNRDGSSSSSSNIPLAALKGLKRRASQLRRLVHDLFTPLPVLLTAPLPPPHAWLAEAVASVLEECYEGVWVTLSEQAVLKTRGEETASVFGANVVLGVIAPTQWPDPEEEERRKKKKRRQRDEEMEIEGKGEGRKRGVMHLGTLMSVYKGAEKWQGIQHRGKGNGGEKKGGGRRGEGGSIGSGDSSSEGESSEYESDGSSSASYSISSTGSSSNKSISIRSSSSFVADDEVVEGEEKLKISKDNDSKSDDELIQEEVTTVVKQDGNNVDSGVDDVVDIVDDDANNKQKDVDEVVAVGTEKQTTEGGGGNEVERGEQEVSGTSDTVTPEQLEQEEHQLEEEEQGGHSTSVDAVPDDEHDYDVASENLKVASPPVT